VPQINSEFITLHTTAGGRSSNILQMAFGSSSKTNIELVYEIGGTPLFKVDGVEGALIDQLCFSLPFRGRVSSIFFTCENINGYSPPNTFPFVPSGPDPTSPDEGYRVYPMIQIYIADPGIGAGPSTFRVNGETHAEATEPYTKFTATGTTRCGSYINSASGSFGALATGTRIAICAQIWATGTNLPNNIAGAFVFSGGVGITYVGEPYPPCHDPSC
jgi:hypothetical protein